MPTHVTVIHGESRREGDFGTNDAVADVVRRLFAREIADRRRVRLIFSGRVREPTDRLVDIAPAIGVASDRSITMHAVVGQQGTAADEPFRSQTSAPQVPQQHIRRAPHTLNIAGLQLRSAFVLLAITGALLVLVSYLQFANPRFASRASQFLTAAVSVVWCSIVYQQCFRRRRQRTA